MMSVQTYVATLMLLNDMVTFFPYQAANLD